MTTLQYNIDLDARPVSKIQKNKFSEKSTKTKAKSIDIIPIESVKDDLKRYATDTIHTNKQDAAYKRIYTDLKTKYDSLEKEMKETMKASKKLNLTVKGLRGTITAKDGKIARLQKNKTKTITKYVEMDIKTMINELTNKLQLQQMCVSICKTCTLIESFLSLF